MQHAYSLTGVVEHLSWGHYVAYTLGSSANWYTCDDSQTPVPIELEEVLKKQAYMLFYMRDVSP